LNAELAIKIKKGVIIKSRRIKKYKMAKKLKIGIPVWEVGPNTLGVTKSYIKFIKRFGNIIYLDPEHELRTDLDGIILPGGADVDTRRYNQAPGLYTGKPDIYKEWFDFDYLPKYIEIGTPIFGICRGMQSLFVHFGGSIHQDIGMDCNIWDHPTNEDKDPWSAQHQASIEQEFLIPMNNDRYEFAINSRHHQVVNDETKPEDIIIISRAKTKNQSDSTIEAFIHNKYPIVAFQGHPEDCFTPLAENLFKYILNNKKSVINLK
jgi:putative glutamine amidotransferase